MEQTALRKHLEQFHIEWSERLGETGELLARDLKQLVDLILEEYQEIVQERIKATVAPWALVGNEELIPLNKISKEGLAGLLANPDYISNGELWELIKLRFP